ncbi:MAG: NAD-dependent protein deacylase [Bacteroidetes bacterium HGW-Bacteroidetes-12]|nr:MAG: NAD-dependent protein deacylase [Bacteroidetes bacterium HGW-Bacteroidetes-12]
MKKIVVFTGAGVSAESGIQTFRDGDGLWENHDIQQVATPEAWNENPRLVLDFYNERRKQVLKATPNKAHQSLVLLEQNFDVQIITQNIDDLHERAGSTRVLHLHGEILKARSTFDDALYDWKKPALKLGDTCPKGYQLRPHVVWFGEPVPNMMEAANWCDDADFLIVIGTSLNVYPAANIVNFVPANCSKYLVDPKKPSSFLENNIQFIQKKAGEGVAELVNQLMSLKAQV